MCGFIGVLRNQANQGKKKLELLKEKNRYSQHRGPDDEGYYVDEYISFGFRRLSIIDLKQGHQPFQSQCERYWLVFNGEIYNYVELREQLIERGYIFQSDSDTEVILALFTFYREEAFQYLRGMFAILIWDKESKTLFGARDPFGIKPLYYQQTNDATYFASEQKSLINQHNDQLNFESLQQYLSFQYVPEPKTLQLGVEKVEPGHYFIQKPNEKMRVHCYWRAGFTPVLRSKEEWINGIRGVLSDSVRIHMRSDVPVGAFLSGGIDSSLIVALAKQFNPKIKTFSVGFEREGYSEIDVAKETADRLEVENISTVVTPKQYVALLPKIVWHMDDPLADPACVPLYFVAKEARKHVKVVLSGEGADELFGGYNIYREPNALKVFAYLPAWLNRMLKQLAKVFPEGMKGKGFIERGTTPLVDRYIGNAKMFENDEIQHFFKKIHTDLRYQYVTRALYEDCKHVDPVNQMQYIDIHTWLRGDILLKADRMTMANSLELRVPFLDKEVFQLASELPVNLKIANKTTKHILREAANGIVPDHVLNRKKLGFPVPIRHWLKDELYDWAKSLITESSTDHLFRKDYVLKLLDLHCQGKVDYSRKIWTVIVFMVWHQVFVEENYLDISQIDRELEQERSIMV